MFLAKDEIIFSVIYCYLLALILSSTAWFGKNVFRYFILHLTDCFNFILVIEFLAPDDEDNDRLSKRWAIINLEWDDRGIYSVPINPETIILKLFWNDSYLQFNNRILWKFPINVFLSSRRTLFCPLLFLKFYGGAPVKALYWQSVISPNYQ